MKRQFVFFLLLFCCLAGHAQTVIDPLLSEEMACRNEDERMAVFVIMKSQYDRMSLNRRADYYATRAERREFVVNELKSFSEASQFELKQFLAEMEHKGMVSSPIILWMSNALYFDANKTAILDLARRNDIAIIGYAKERNCIPDGEAPTAALPTREIMPNVLQVQADRVWELGYRGQGVVVALIDTGVNYNHVDVADHLWDGGEEFPHHGYDVFNHDDDPMDEHGHGSHCAGIICGDGTAGSQTGMAPDATLMCVRCTNPNSFCNAANMVEGIQWAVEHGCDLFSMSLGLRRYGNAEQVLLRHTCEAVLDAGVVAAIAAGNEGDKLDDYPLPNNIRVPGSCPPPYMDEIQEDNPGGLSCVVCVGAVDDNDTAAYFTSLGPAAWANTEFGDYPYNPGIGLIRPDVCAPGVGIKSLYYGSNDGYFHMSGTSMATPCVAGCMALMLSRDNNLTPADVCRILEESAVPLSEGKSNTYGFGRVDALAAVEAIPLGGIRYQSFAINDSLGNNNHNLNPGESVTMSLTLKNVSNEPVGNVSAVLRTENEHVTMVQDSVAFPDFATNDSLTVADAFAFSVDEQVTENQKIKFKVEVYIDGESIGMFKDYIIVYDYHIQYQDAVVLNDDNGDGIFNSGETANLRVQIENRGNEMSPWMTGTLSTDSPLVTLNETEKSFASIAEGNVGYADFNLTLDASATIDMAVPFTLDLVGADGRHTELLFIFKNTCTVVFSLLDSFADGWEENYLQVDYSDGTPSEQMTLSDGESETFVRELVHGSTFTISWHGSSWSQECSFEITYEDGAVIFQNGGGFDEVLTFSVNCTQGIGVDDFLETSQKINIFPNPATDVVTIQCPDMKLIEVYTIEGKLLRSVDINNDTYYLEGLESGVYLIRIDKWKQFVVLHL